MSFVDVRFPADIAFGSSGGPQYSTDIVITQGGYEQRNANWAQARARFNVAHGIKTQAQLDALIAFFRARKGRAYAFRFKDWTDYTLSGEAIGTGTGVQTAFQLVKAYHSGGASELRPITKPVAGSLKVYVNAVLQGVGAYSIGWNTGVVTFVAAPAAGAIITADCEFDVPVRFDTDQLSATLESYTGRSWSDIPLVEVRV